MKEFIHQNICRNLPKIVSWYEDIIESAYVPFYSSYDIRDAIFKFGNVDGNIFPAGFNNICQADKEAAPQVIEDYLVGRSGSPKHILILTEDHLKNLYYWENVATIADLLKQSGHEVTLGMLSPEVTDVLHLTTISGKSLVVHHVFSEDGKLRTKELSPCLVISNNDFSSKYPEVDFSKTNIIPARELGWYQRRKDRYFTHYNRFAKEFAELIAVDPWHFTVETKIFENLDVADDTARVELGARVDEILASTQQKYREYGIQEPPFVVIKNNAGTYGLAVTQAYSGEDVVNWNYKAKKKMKATKGGGGVNTVIVQEGIPSALMAEAATAEPVIYMIGSELVGGFLRTHSEKDPYESLNSPGAVFRRLCLSDLNVRLEGCLLENVYGWVARLGLLAITQEAKDLGLTRGHKSC